MMYRRVMTVNKKNLQDMRENSPTGGTLGSKSKKKLQRMRNKSPTGGPLGLGVVKKSGKLQTGRYSSDA